MIKRPDRPCRRQLRLTPPPASTAWRRLLRPYDALMQSPSRGWRWDGDRFTQLRTTGVFRLPGDSAWYRFFPGAWRPVELGEGALVLVTCVGAPGHPSGVLRDRPCIVDRVFDHNGRKHIACTPTSEIYDLPSVVVDAATVTPVTGVNELQPQARQGTNGGLDLEDPPDGVDSELDEDDYDDEYDDEPDEVPGDDPLGLDHLEDDGFYEFDAGSVIERYDSDTRALRSENPAHYDPTECTGRSGLVWYSRVTPVLGADLKPRDFLDALGHSGAQQIYRISAVDEASGTRVVSFSTWPGHTMLVHCTTTYDVVDPTSAVTPDGTPIAP